MDRSGIARRASALVAGILAASLLSACGQRGPLYLPTPPAEPTRRAAPPTVLSPVPRPAPAAPGTAGDAVEPQGSRLPR